MSKFWEKNKKKSKWALLLLLLRWRKGVVPLLLLVLLIIFMFAAPSNLMATLVRGLAATRWGYRPAAAITWVGSRLGLSGFDNGQHSFADLLAAMRAAKEANKTGLGVFLRGDAGRASGGDSLGYVRGSATDNGPANLAAKVKGGESVNGILNKEEAGKGVELDSSDYSGEREGIVQSAYGKGTEFGPRRVGGLTSAFGDSNATGRGSDAAGAFVSNHFFSASGHAANPDAVRAGMSGKTVPIAGQTETATRRPIGWQAPNANGARASRSARNYRVSGGRALAQLVQTRNAGLMSSGSICNMSNGCPSEYASWTIGHSYDNNNNTGDKIYGGADPNVSPASLSGPVDIDGFSSPNIPDPNTDLSGATDVDNAIDDPAVVDECMKILNDCQDVNAQAAEDIRHLVEDPGGIDYYSDKMGGDCDDCCDCGPCDTDVHQIQNKCVFVNKDLDKLNTPCDLPPKCANLGCDPTGKDVTKPSCGATQKPVNYSTNIDNAKNCDNHNLGNLADSCASANLNLGIISLCVCPPW